MDLDAIRLTETVVKGGCAAKLPAGQLRAVLSQLRLPKPPELAVGTENLDDACLWDLGDGRFLIQTLDFFTPMVDDAYSFGSIAAANALSDVYAMGGKPKIALTILAFPASTQPVELIGRLMAGALATITAAGACLGGGHTIDDDTLKLGFSVTGFVDKDQAWTNARAQPGDALILTKGLGTGTITSAIKSKRADPAWISGAIASMTLLNDTEGLLQDTVVHAATDITGFGLAGHLLQVAQASNVGLQIDLTALPALPGARLCLEQEILNRAHRTNADYVAPHVRYVGGTAVDRWLTVDPQTSGGLLLVVPEAACQATVERLRQRFPLAARIGSVLPAPAEQSARLVFRG